MTSTPISQFESVGLGLLRNDRVELSDYNPRWKSVFSKEAHRIFEVLKISELCIYHVGSTSIPGIKAKPILDVLISTPSLEALDSRKEVFEKLGYEYKGEYGIPGRRYCVLYNVEKTKGYVHIHAFAEGHVEIERHLVFRDFLRAYPEKANMYQALKLQLLLDPKTSRAEYTDSKTPLIQKLLEEAVLWKKSRVQEHAGEVAFEFRPLTADDIPLLRKWLEEPHVEEFWQEPENEVEFRDKYLNKLKARDVQSYIVYANSLPIGYVQKYEACLVGGGWWPDAKPGTFGIDQYIGDPNWVGKGFGTLFIRQFVNELFSDTKVVDVITDPDPKNSRAIRAYEKVGFKRVDLMQTPGGDALLLKVTRADWNRIRAEIC